MHTEPEQFFPTPFIAVQSKRPHVAFAEAGSAFKPTTKIIQNRSMSLGSVPGITQPATTLSDDDPTSLFRNSRSSPNLAKLDGEVWEEGLVVL
jgi:hypothetical protein